MAQSSIDRRVLLPSGVCEACAVTRPRAKSPPDDVQAVHARKQIEEAVGRISGEEISGVRQRTPGEELTRQESEAKGEPGQETDPGCLVVPPLCLNLCPVQGDAAGGEDARIEPEKAGQRQRAPVG